MYIKLTLFKKRKKEANYEIDFVSHLLPSNSLMFNIRRGYTYINRSLAKAGHQQTLYLPCLPLWNN